ncbi:MAG: hypothetical protein ABSH52_14250 [Terriglobia bacterium]
MRCSALSTKNPCNLKPNSSDASAASLKPRLRTLAREPELSKSDAVVRDFCDELTQAFDEAKAEWDAIDRHLPKRGEPTLGNAIATDVVSLTLPAERLVVGGIDELTQAIKKRHEIRKKALVSVFVDLLRR